MAGPPVPGGAVLVGSDGRLVAAGPEDAVPRPPGVPTETLPGAAILPGLVNTHTHLELTGFDGLVPETAFPTWIRRLRTLKEERSPEEFLAAARRGLADCHAAGITTVADTGDSGASVRALAERGGSGIVYLEVFGPHPAQCREALDGLQRRVEAARPLASSRVRLGLSPHAPYTVSAPLYQAVARWADEVGLPIAVHLAESADESALLGEAGGAFAEAWRRRGIPLPPLPGRSPVRWLDQHGVLGPRTLGIHLVRATDEDLRTLAARGVGVAHCPRSNRRHGHGDADLSALLTSGLRVGVGTDSVASIAPLDLLAEARAARTLAGLDAEAALALCTTGAASALGLDGEVGCLVPGGWGDVTAFALPETRPRGPADVLESVLQATPADVRLTLLAGEPVYRREEGGAAD